MLNPICANDISIKSNLLLTKWAPVRIQIQSNLVTLIQDFYQMLILLLIGLAMNHYIICYHISCGVDVLKVEVHVVLKKVLSLD